MSLPDCVPRQDYNFTEIGFQEEETAGSGESHFTLLFFHSQSRSRILPQRYAPRTAMLLIEN